MYPLPRISDLVDSLKHSCYFTKLDIRWGYNNIWIKETDQWKAAFTTPYGLYEPMVMFFGQCNSPPMFQAFMNYIFADYLAEGWLIIYMDNLMVHSADLTEHIARIQLVLQRLRKHKLGVKLEKCIFCAPQAEYLGLIVGEGQISMDPVKLTAINDWTPPCSVSAVRSFMGFCNFYQKFIPNFSNIIQPLLSLTKKNAAWQWLPDHAASFQTLKDAFLKRPVLHYPDTDLPFFVMTDASLVASGAVLMQKDGNGDLHPCTYYSKMFALAERNYDIYDRELLAIIWSLEEWCQYLTGTKHPVTIITNHQNLMYFKSPQNLS